MKNITRLFWLQGPPVTYVARPKRGWLVYAKPFRGRQNGNLGCKCLLWTLSLMGECRMSLGLNDGVDPFFMYPTKRAGSRLPAIPVSTAATVARHWTLLATHPACGWHVSASLIMPDRPGRQRDQWNRSCSCRMRCHGIDPKLGKALVEAYQAQWIFLFGARPNRECQGSGWKDTGKPARKSPSETSALCKESIGLGSTP
jgi:hypothetical protein